MASRISYPQLLGNSTEVGPILSTLAMTVSFFFFRLLSLLGYARLTISAPSGHTKAEVAFNTLQTWYNTSSGIYDTTGWWNSANCLTAVGDLAAIDATVLPEAIVLFLNTAVQARKLIEFLKICSKQLPCSYVPQKSLKFIDK